MASVDENIFADGRPAVEIRVFGISYLCVLGEKDETTMYVSCGNGSFQFPGLIKYSSYNRSRGCLRWQLIYFLNTLSSTLISRVFC
jgi:hypothetical protein